MNGLCSSFQPSSLPLFFCRETLPFLSPLRRLLFFSSSRRARKKKKEPLLPILPSRFFMLSHTLWFNADPQGGLLYQTKNSFKGQDYFSTGRSCPFFPHNEIWYYLKHPLGKVNVVSFLTFSSVFIFAEVYTSPSSRPLFWLKKFNAWYGSISLMMMALKRGKNDENNEGWIWDCKSLS